CPENSHYELCGSACPATCMYPNPATNCSLPCVETCTCNPGFVLSGAVCVPSSSCGCSQNGRYVPAGESFWLDDRCSMRCSCPAGGGQIVCQNTSCKAGQQCQVLNDIRDCYPVSQKTCLAFGDPHYLSFDGRRFDFQGTSVYQLVGMCSNDSGLVPFEVLVQNDFRSKMVSFTKLLQVNQYSSLLSQVNGILLNLPQNLNNGQVSAFKSGWAAVVQTSFGLTVAFDWNSIASVSVPSTYMGAVCGLCGNYNGKPEDDLTLRGTNYSSSRPDEFGASWKINGVTGFVQGCGDNCTDCDVTQRKSYESAEYCGVIRDPNGPFLECQPLLDPAGFFEACISDVCVYSGRRDILCQAISAYISACQDIGARVYSWRTTQFCGVHCPLHSHYDVCGPGCPTTCYSLGSTLSCQRPCKEGCVCDQGFILSGDDCVPFTQCGCLYNGQYYSQGQTFYPDSLCQTQCNTVAVVVCRNISCGLYELCAVVNGVRGCQPVGKAVCEAAGDPHYTSFDGLHFNFQGTCRYTLSQACGLQGTDLVPFSVEVENERWPYGAFKVSVTKQVSLAVFGHTFVLRQNMVNGLLTNLPWSLNGSKVQISKEGINYVMTTDFGLRVTYNLLYYVTVTVPSTYRNKTCGLCGNFDGNPSNDFLLPNGNITTDKIAFGKAWKVAVSGVQCEDDCQGSQCPDCSPSLRAVFERPAYCGLLSDPLGPFAPCHAVVDPSAYLRDCVFDVCISGGSSTVACQSVAAYAFKCQTAGVALKSWRTDSFCPLSCPAHSHYELCADACSAACPGLTDIIKCSSNCTEGCTCDPGYMFNGHDCVQYLQCGCYEDGRTYELGEVVFQAQCQQKCMCDPVMGFLCETHTCSNGTHCMVRNGVEACFHTGQRHLHCYMLVHITTCWAWGDPHYITFDGFNFDFQGTCRYTLSKTCGLLDGLEPFSVTESNDKRGNNLVSVVREVEVEVYGRSLLVDLCLQVNGERLYLPLVLLGGRVRVKQVGSSAIMETDFGLRVSYNWNSLLYLQLPSSYYNRVCGLCGNYNGSRNDELRDPVGVPQATVAQWTSSWKSNKSEANCSDGCERDCPMFSADQQKLYNTDAYCGALTSTSLDVFTPCHAKVDPAVFQQSCVYDLYFNNGNPMLLCDALEAYVSRCRLEGIVITGWREKFNCPMRCQPHSHYEACASPCNSTCPSMQLQPNCTGVCVEACVCDPGFFLSGSTCLPADQCGCFYEGRYYQQGQSFWADEKCRRRCVCDSTLGVVVCREDSCSAKEICAVVDGVRMCVASSSATCEVFGDPHYRTFDGQLYDFQGSCMYQLVALCSNRTDLVPFNVTVQNEHRGSSAVSLTRTVMVSVFGLYLVKEMKVNMLVVYRSGITVVLETVFGLQVTFDWIGRLQVSLPSVYGGAVCGLCGNYNGSSQDDFTMPNGTIAPNDMALGQSWQVGSTPDCSSALCQNTQCFNCSGTQKEDAQRNCSIITDQTGPFKECHAMVDPRPYAANCVFDTCQYQGRQSVLCDSIAVYVSACQSKGVAVRPWRNGTFCSLSCPANSQYSLCAPGCVETCASLSSTCRRPCAEGCRCDPGFVFSGQTCVPLAECGCFYGGRYYKKRQVFYTDVQCQTRCECIENGAVVCQKSSCGLGEMCGVIDGVLGCHPNGYSSCLVTGDPHYTSFDGRMFDFQGVCVYTLAKVCTNAGEKLVYFSVETENESVGWASAVKAVTVSVYNFTIKIRQDESGEWRMRVSAKDSLHSPPSGADTNYCVGVRCSRALSEQAKLTNRPDFRCDSLF
uniref:VWFD domain-containing protein n=1 Tax=Pygocentrus nattereri TaxID=42514 RepID=A0A3B4EIB1_PYGNA